METSKAASAQPSRVRKRHLMRLQKHMATPHLEKVDDYVSSHSSRRKMRRVRARWIPISHQPRVIKVVAVIGIVLLLWFAATHLLAGHVFPNIWVLGTSIGNMPIDATEARLLEAWDSQIKIQLMDGNRVWTVSPDELGLHLDAKATAEQARSIGMAGIPLGYNVEPVVSVNSVEAQAYLLGLAAQVENAPVNAGFEWHDDQLVTIAGRTGHRLDIDRTLTRLEELPTIVVIQKRLDLITLSPPPDVTDATAYLEDARRLTSQPFALTGYDPFRDEFVT